MTNPHFEAILLSKKAMLECIANKYHISYLTRDDLLQEARMVLWRIYNRNPALLSQNTYMSKSITNKFRTMTRNYVYRDVYLETGVDLADEKNNAVIDNLTYEMDETTMFYDQFIDLIDMKFNPVESYIIKQKIKGHTLEEIRSLLKRDMNKTMLRQSVDISIKRNMKTLMKLAKESGAIQ